MSASIAGDVVVVFNEKDEQLEIVYTFCPNTGIRFFFQHHPEIKKAVFQLWHRVFRPYSNDVQYVKKPLGTFTKAQVEAAGESPVAEVIDLFRPLPVKVEKVKVEKPVAEAKGKSLFSRVKELCVEGKTKQDAFPILQQEYQEANEKRIKMLIHSGFAIARKETTK